MAKGSEELTNARKTEIIEACKSLYRTMSFKEVTIKEIGSITSFTRTSIYNYFQTKEEIFLAILQEEYGLLNAGLRAELDSHSSFTADSLAEILARTLSQRGLLLKILSMNMFDIEQNSRLEKLVEFKLAYGECLGLVDKCLEKLDTQPNAVSRQDFIYSFFPFIFGIYPYTSVTAKQVQAMETAGLEYRKCTIYDITLSAAKRLLKGGDT